MDSEGVRLVAGWEQWESGGWWVLVDYGMYRRFRGDGSGAKVHALRFRPLIVPQTADWSGVALCCVHYGYCSFVDHLCTRGCHRCHGATRR